MHLEQEMLRTELDSLRQEVEALRRACHQPARGRGRWLLFACGLVAGAIMGQALLSNALAVPQGEAKEISCRMLKIVGPTGKAMVVIGYDEDGGLVDISGQDGNRRAILGVGAMKGPGYLAITGSNQKPQVYIDADSDGGAFKIFGSDGNQRVFLGVAPQVGGGLLNLMDTSKKVRMLLEGADGGGIIQKQ
jgi:hypothetical protein